MTNTPFSEWSRRWQSGDRSVVAEVEKAVRESSPDAPIDFLALGELCETMGLVGPAFHAFQRALGRQAADPRILRKLAAYYAERGELRRAAELWERLLRVLPGDAEAVDELASVLVAEGSLPELRRVLDAAVAAGYPAERSQAWLAQVESHRESPDEASAIPSRDDPFPLPTDADCVRFATLFGGREDVYARQWCRPDDRRVGYTPVHEPFTPAVARQHLLGSITVGVYPIRLDQTATWFAIDLDIRRDELDSARRNHRYATELRQQMRDTGLAILRELRALGLEPLFENSGYKGRHYWVFLEQPQEARSLHHLGRLLLARLQPLLPPAFSLEFFPKQARRSGKGLGNLIKLPLGIHLRTGYRSVLLDDEGRPLADPYGTLRSVQRVGPATFLALVDRLKGVAPPESETGGAEAPSETSGESAAATEIPLWPPDAPPPWTEADFETDPKVRHVLRCCPVLAALKEKVDEHRQLSHDEQVVLIHSLGHLESGPQAVNYLIHRCLEYSPEMLMQSRLKGNPISCPKIRKRIGHITRRVPCACDFSFAPNHYPTPVLHLETLSEAEAAEMSKESASGEAESVEELIRRYTVIVHRRQEIEQEWQELHDSLCKRLAALPDRSITTEQGRFFLDTNDGVETLRWEEREGD